MIKLPSTQFILMFTCGKRKQAVSRLRRLITSVDEEMKGHYTQVYMQFSGMENVLLTFSEGPRKYVLETRGLPKCRADPPACKDPFHTQTFQSPGNDFSSKLFMVLSCDIYSVAWQIFNWNFDRIEAVAWQHLCESLYDSGCMKEVGETLLKMVGPLAEDEKEYAHGRILEAIVTRSREATLLEWTGKSSKCNSCLPSSPAVYGSHPSVPLFLPQAELEKRTSELRAIFSLIDAVVVHARLTRLQPIRFSHFRLLLPCVVFGVTHLRKVEENVYLAQTTGLGDVEFTTAYTLSLKEPGKLVFVDTRIHGLQKPHGGAFIWEDRLAPDGGSRSDFGSSADTDAELVHAQIIEEVPPSPSESDSYTRALQLIAHLEQSFSALLLWQQSDGSYKRVAADHEVVVRGTGKKFPRDVRVEVLEIL